MAGFLDDVRNALSRGVEGVSGKYKSMTSSAELRGTVKPLVSQIDELLKKLGEIVFEARNNNDAPNNEEIGKLCGKIAILKEMVEDKMATYAAAESAAVSAVAGTTSSATADTGLKCSCGGTIKSTSKFCPLCGKTIEAPFEVSERNCPDCGAALNGN